MTDQENTGTPGNYFLCFLTVAKHQAPDADNQGKPQRTGHLYLHMDLRENMFAIEQAGCQPTRNYGQQKCGDAENVSLKKETQNKIYYTADKARKAKNLTCNKKKSVVLQLKCRKF